MFDPPSANDRKPLAADLLESSATAIPPLMILSSKEIQHESVPCLVGNRCLHGTACSGDGRRGEGRPQGQRPAGRFHGSLQRQGPDELARPCGTAPTEEAHAGAA